VKRLRTGIVVAAYAFRSGLADYSAVFSWRSWVFGWLARILAQVSFFGLIGLAVGDRRLALYLLVGNAIAVAAQLGINSLTLTLEERWTGTLPLLVSCPSSPLLVFASRGSYSALDGAISALVALGLGGLCFGLHFPWPDTLLVVPLTAIVAATAYCFGTFLAGLVFRFREIEALVVNTTYVGLMALCAVNVPLSYYPSPLRYAVHFLPLTNGLVAIREVLGSAPLGSIAVHAAADVAVGIGWLLLALATFDRLLSRGRLDGSLELGA
jgi:ABC-2 type transport system permease protein